MTVKKWLVLILLGIGNPANVYAEEYAGNFTVSESVLQETFPEEISLFSIDESLPVQFTNQAPAVFNYDPQIYQTTEVSLDSPLFQEWSIQTETEQLFLNNNHGSFYFQYIKRLDFNPFELSIPFINYFAYPDQRDPNDLMAIDESVTQQDLAFMSQDLVFESVNQMLTELGLKVDYQISIYSLPKEYYSVLEDYTKSMKSDADVTKTVNPKDSYAIRIIPKIEDILFNTQTMGSVEKGSVVIGSQIFMTLTEDGITSFSLNGYEQPDRTQANKIPVSSSEVIELVKTKYDNILLVGDVSLISVELQYYIFVNTMGNDKKSFIRPFWNVTLEHTIQEENGGMTVYHPVILIDVETKQEVILQ